MAIQSSRSQLPTPQSGEFEEKVIKINRVSKKTKGGNKISFSALMVVGDKKGRVGVALGKAPDVRSAIKKGSRRARKKLIKIPMKRTTIPFPLQVKRGAAIVLLKPAPPGTGIKAGGAVRAVVEAAGVRDIVAKMLGSSNKASNVYATFEAMQKMKQIASKKQIKFSEKQQPPAERKRKEERTAKKTTEKKRE